MKRFAVTLLLVLVAAGLFYQAGRSHPALLEQRKTFTPGQVDVVENMPPMVAFVTVALGGFRGLIADALWMRASRMQEEGRYFELVQLADWITNLEPRFTPVWSFHAWNLAYNVSVMMNDPTVRWRWVQQGIRLLRDEALIYNPGDAELFWQLGWLFQHKMGMGLDQAHLYYKNAWAHEMMALFDGPAPDYEALAQIPESREALLGLPDVEAVVTGLTERGLDPWNLATFQSPDSDLDAWLPETEGADTLVAFLRRERMIETYRLDPAIMQTVDEAHGPFDWRLPDAHAVYWAFQGRRHADDEAFVEERLLRMVAQSTISAFRGGRALITLDGTVAPSPNPDLLPRVRTLAREAVDSFPDRNSFRQAHMNFLSEMFGILLQMGRTDQARDVYREIHENYPSKDSAGGFEYFAAVSFAGSLEKLSAREAAAMVEGALTQSFVYYAMGDQDRFEGYQAQAQRIWQQFTKSLGGGERKDRYGLQPLAELRRQALDRLLNDVQDPALRQRIQTLVAAPSNPEPEPTGP